MASSRQCELPLCGDGLPQKSKSHYLPPMNDPPMVIDLNEQISLIEHAR